MKSIWLLIFTLVGFASSAPAQTVPMYVLADGFDDLAAGSWKVRDAFEVSRSPLFSNAPYLHLRPGDQLVRARIDPDGHGLRFSGPEGSDTVYYFVQAKGKYFLLATAVDSNGKDGKPSCAAEQSLLFDWKLTIETARDLRNLWLSQHAVPLSTAQYDAIVRAAQKGWPEIRVESDSGVQADRLVSVAGHDFAVLQGWCYDRSLDRIYRYTIKIGAGIFSVSGEAFVQGPPPVDRSEFEQNEIPGAPKPKAVDPEIARKKRVEFDKTVEFQELIEKIIQSEAAADSLRRSFNLEVASLFTPIAQ